MPATLPWPKMPNTPPKNGCSRPSRARRCCDQEPHHRLRHRQPHRVALISPAHPVRAIEGATTSSSVGMKLAQPWRVTTIAPQRVAHARRALERPALQVIRRGTRWRTRRRRRARSAPRSETARRRRGCDIRAKDRRPARAALQDQRLDAACAATARPRCARRRSSRRGGELFFRPDRQRGRPSRAAASARNRARRPPTDPAGSRVDDDRYAGRAGGRRRREQRRRAPARG